jgi:hypothetical protein
MITQCGEQLLPEQLPGLLSAQLKKEPLSFLPQPFRSGLFQKAGLPFRRQIFKRELAARQTVGKSGQIELIKRKFGMLLKQGLERNLDQPGNLFSRKIDQMKTDPAVSGILMVMVLKPRFRADMNLQVTLNPPLGTPNPQNGAEEIRTGTGVPLPGMLNLYGLAGKGSQFSGTVTRVRPEALQMALAVGKIVRSE